MKKFLPCYLRLITYQYPAAPTASLRLFLKIDSRSGARSRQIQCLKISHWVIVVCPIAPHGGWCGWTGSNGQSFSREQSNFTIVIIVSQRMLDQLSCIRIEREGACFDSLPPPSFRGCQIVFPISHFIAMAKAAHHCGAIFLNSLSRTERPPKVVRRAAAVRPRQSSQRHSRSCRSGHCILGWSHHT